MASNVPQQKRDLQFATLRNGDGKARTVHGLCGDIFNLAHHNPTVKETAKDNVLSVEKVALGARDEKLGMNICRTQSTTSKNRRARKKWET